MSSVITISQLAKHYQVPEREAELKASLTSLFNRKYRTVKAVNGISFNIEPGEVVGFLGPNGAGKTTTLKMLSGLLHPTSGDIHVMGFEPFRRSYDYLRQITLIMGNRNQLTWDLPRWTRLTCNARCMEFLNPNSNGRAMISLICLN